MKIYLDDMRPTPAGWVRCYWPDEVIAHLKSGAVTELSLDHDLGDDARGTGYDVLAWIEQAMVCDGFVPPRGIAIHTSNPAARARMEAAKSAIKRRISASPSRRRSGS